MGENSQIEWTDHTFNPWIGCAKVDEGCRHCYAEADFDKRKGRALWGLSGTRVLTTDQYWRQPLAWNKEAATAGERRRVFCASLADVFEDWDGPMQAGLRGEVVTKPPSDLEAQPEHWRRASQEDMERDPQGWRYVTMDDVRSKLFRLIDCTPHLDWLLLTKRPENIRRMWREWSGDYESLNSRKRWNVWLGTSVSDQASADKRIPQLLQCRDLSPVLFLSIEPLLGPITLQQPETVQYCLACDAVTPTTQVTNGTDFECGRCGDMRTREREFIDYIGWVIVGGESGHGARPMHPDWVRDVRNQCQAAEVPFFFKQWGEWRPTLPAIAGSPEPVCRGSVTWGTLNRSGEWFPTATPWNGRQDADSLDGECVMTHVGKKVAGRTLDGREWSQFPTP